MKKLEKKYNFAEGEKKWQKYWQDNEIFKFDWNDIKRENIYSIDTPPPHVSGSLHMGHIFAYSQMDTIARFQRMFGKNVFYPVGFDDNGLPSERYVEKKIGKKSKSMDRQEFVKICDKEIQDAEQFMREQFIKMSYSFDFSQAYRTISPTARKVSQMSFIDLYNKGALYRKEEPIIWDVVDQTALAQTEAEDKEIESQMNYIEFSLSPITPPLGLSQTSKVSTTPITPPLRGSQTDEIGLVGGYKKLYSQKALDYAKKLRNNTTDAEKLLWYYLKDRQMLDIKFRRQAPIGDYIVDFVSFEIKLVIELDGGQHNEDKSIKYDEKRTKFLEDNGFKVIRFWDNDIFKNMDGVLETIYDIIKTITPHQTNSVRLTPPQGGSDRGGRNSVGLTPHQGGSDSLSQKGGSSKLIIMTTRPELLPACVAIFAHPDDRAKYEGKSAITPLGVRVPILFDESVEKDKGTGVMMCCTFGDGADVEKYKKYNLPLKMTINERGCLYFDNVPEIYEKYKSRLDGLFTEKARAEILNILEEEGKIARAPEKIVHNVKVGERSKSPLEILVKNQWNIKTLDIKEELHKMASEVNWNPDWMEARMHNWIDGLSWNWTISRQRFFGVPVPCWYSKRAGEEGKIILPEVEDLPVDPTVDLPRGYPADEVIGESDVFDTWMTSSVSPQLSMQGVSADMNCDKKRFETLDIPFDLRPQGHDIIRTWAFCTIVKSYYHENKIPWKNIFINGFCLASDGTKMSKSKGNGVDPIKVVNEFGADAVRYWALNSQLGTDTNYSVDMIKVGQKLITKLFNSAKFAEMNFENLTGNISTPKSDLSDNFIFETIDKWLISKTKKAIEKATRAFENYEYSKALEAVEDLFWNDFCDNYLEIVKGRAYGLNFLTYSSIDVATLTEQEKNKIVKSQQSAIRTIYYVFNAILKLFAPFVPAITDEIYSCIYEDEFNKTKSISTRGNWPRADNFVEDDEAEKVGQVALDIVAEVRKYKSEKNISIKEKIEKIEVYTPLAAEMNAVVEDLKNVCNVDKILFIDGKEFKILY